jgi:hypothetical protein
MRCKRGAQYKFGNLLLKLVIFIVGCGPTLVATRHFDLNTQTRSGRPMLLPGSSPSRINHDLYRRRKTELMVRTSSTESRGNRR